MTVDAIGPSLEVWFILFLPWAGPVAVLAWILGCRRVRWRVADFAIVIVPYAVWFAVDEIWHRPKSLANLGEAILLAIIVDAIIIARVIVGKKCNQSLASVGALGLASLAAVIVWRFTPCLPE